MAIEQALQHAGIQVEEVRSTKVHLIHTQEPLAPDEQERIGEYFHNIAVEGQGALYDPRNFQDRDCIIFTRLPRRETPSKTRTIGSEFLRRGLHIHESRKIEAELLVILQIRTNGSIQEGFEALRPHHNALHNRMTEILIEGLPTQEDIEHLFGKGEPNPEIQTFGKIQEAEEALGLHLPENQKQQLQELMNGLQRPATDVELMSWAQINSEHCRHHIFNRKPEDPGQPSMMEMIRHTVEANPGGVISAFSDNAAVIQGHDEGTELAPDPFTGVYKRYPRNQGDPERITIKAETHNHPTGVEPREGAATGAGGEIRDLAATGRGGTTKAGMTGYMTDPPHLPGLPGPTGQMVKEGDPEFSRPNRYASPLQIMLEAPLGASGYVNEFGRPNLGGFWRTFRMRDPETGEERGYIKPVMLSAGMGSIRLSHARKLPIEDGNLILVLGGPAMRIGLGGATASSGSAADELDFASVQRGEAEMERRCQEVLNHCRRLGRENPIRSIHDVGAGGLSNAVPEIVHDCGMGARIDLETVPTDDPSLTPMETWCCEAQERYVLAIAPSGLETIQAICKRERCPIAVIGHATQENRMTILHQGRKAMDVAMSFLFP